MKLLQLESGSTLTAVVELKPHAAVPDMLQGVHSSYEDTVFLVVPDDVSVREAMRKHFESKSWDEESIELALQDVGDDK